MNFAAITTAIFQIFLALSMLLACGTVTPAFAQSTFQYTVIDNGTANDIDGSIGCAGAARLTQIFTVTDNFTVGDVDLGFIASHSWRGDIVLTLISPGPSPVSVAIITGDFTFSGSADNQNVRLDDDGSELVNVTNTNHTLDPPPYANQFIPNNPLSAFNGINSSGDWTLEICDGFPGADNGNFFRADLFLTAASTNLSVIKISNILSDGISGSNPKAIPGAALRYCITISNAGPAEATSINVTDDIPANLSFVSGSIRSGTSCASTPTIEDDDAVGSDESDPIGASISGNIVVITNNNLPPGNDMAVTFNATID